MLGNVGSTELIVIFVILLLIFGGKKLPELGKGLGDAMHEFKKSMGDEEEPKTKEKEKKS